MNVYVSNIVVAAFSFPVIAAFITMPYLIRQYRAFGSVPWMRTLVVYSFAFYLLCAYFLVILPLPADRSAVVPYAAVPQLVPFNFIRELIAESAIAPGDPRTWLAALRNPLVYEAVFNVLLTVPLGMYLRYYFRCSLKKTAFIGFLTTLFFETSQITGLWGLYAHPYRLFDVDDLMLNTLGTLVGFAAVGPMMHMLPDIRLVNAEARLAGLHASATRRALSFILDATITTTLAMPLAALLHAATFGSLPTAQTLTEAATDLGAISLASLVFFVAVPCLTRGQTIGQMILKLRIVRPDAAPARWYQYAARYGILYLAFLLPAISLVWLLSLDPQSASEHSALMAAIVDNQVILVVGWLIVLTAWLASLVVRATRSARRGQPFVMINGLLSNTRVMTLAGIDEARSERLVLDVARVVALEQTIAANGLPLAELMYRAGTAVADEVKIWVPDPKPVVILTGSGNNGGDGWVAAYELARSGYRVTLIAPDIAERVKAEPARQTACDLFSAASAEMLPLHVLIAPDADILASALDEAAAVIDAVLGTGFSGDSIREPYASWIEAANRRRFAGTRKPGRGRHRRRTREALYSTALVKRRMPDKAKNAPFAVAVDTPSGLCAQTGIAAQPCFAADETITMLACKPGLMGKEARRWTGRVHRAKLLDDEETQRLTAATAFTEST